MNHEQQLQAAKRAAFKQEKPTCQGCGYKTNDLNDQARCRKCDPTVLGPVLPPESIPSRKHTYKYR